MSFVKTKDGVEIYYKDWGKGQPIVFSHGWPLSADDWDAQMMFFLNQGYTGQNHRVRTQVAGHAIPVAQPIFAAVVPVRQRALSIRPVGPRHVLKPPKRAQDFGLGLSAAPRPRPGERQRAGRS